MTVTPEVTLTVPDGEVFLVSVLEEDGKSAPIDLDVNRLETLIGLGSTLPAREALSDDAVDFGTIEIGDGVRVVVDGVGVTHEVAADLLTRSLIHALERALADNA